jgi:hypothetical protein
MGMFDFFMSEDKRIARQQRTLTNRDVQGEDREKAARWLADNGTPKALVALLTRFDLQLESGLKDRAEKDFVYKLALGFGAAIERPLERHLERCRQIALPLRLYVELKGDAAAVERVFSLLEHERKKDDFKPQKKLDLLVWLAERRHPGAVEAASASLEDFDEGVRYAAAEVIIGQQDEAGRKHLERILRNAAEESNRLRVRIADVFAQRRWTVDDADAVNLPGGFAFREGRVVAA